MPSTHLTRVVFRRLVAEQTLQHSGCLARSRAARLAPRRGVSSLTVDTNQRRNFFGISLFTSRRKGAVEARLEPGVDKLMEHSKRLRLRARLNPHAEIRNALVAFFRHKITKDVLIQDQQIGLVLRGYKYIRGKTGGGLGVDELRSALKALIRYRRPKTERALKEGQQSGRVALMIYADLLRALHADGQPIDEQDQIRCLDALCECGQAAKARELAFASSLREVMYEEDQADILSTGDLAALDLPNVDLREKIYKVIRGFMWLDSEQEISATLAKATTHGVDVEKDMMIAKVMCMFYASKDRARETKEWYQKLEDPIANDASMRKVGFWENMVRFSLRTNDLEFGNQIISDLLSMPPKHALRDLVLVWACGTGKGPDEIERMMSVMEESTKQYEANTDTINSLISLALWKGDAYLAERFFQLGAKRGIEPNARTFLMQIDYRLSVGDVDGALLAYSQMQTETAPETSEAAESVNKLIVGMCGTKRHDFDSIMNVAADLTDWGARFEAETVSTLAILHMSRAEAEDAEDLVNTHTFNYSIEERQMVLNSMIDFIDDAKTSEDTAWSTYQLVKKAFDDMDREQRTRLMKGFFRRENGHLAMQIFEHMRLHTREDTVPLVDTYITALAEIAKLGDEEAFAMLYNLLKLDTSIEPNTALNNALMLASVECGMSRRALTFWNAITTSGEGPDITSIRLALKACESAPEGDAKAREIHRRLEKSGFGMQGEYYAWVLAALGAHGHISEALNIMEHVEQDKGIAPTLDMVGGLANAAPSKERQEEILSWATVRAPAIHKNLEKRAVGTDMMGRSMYQLAGSLDSASIAGQG